MAETCHRLSNPAFQSVFRHEVPGQTTIANAFQALCGNRSRLSQPCASSRCPSGSWIGAGFARFHPQRQSMDADAHGKAGLRTGGRDNAKSCPPRHSARKWHGMPAHFPEPGARRGPWRGGAHGLALRSFRPAQGKRPFRAGPCKPSPARRGPVSTARERGPRKSCLPRTGVRRCARHPQAIPRP